MKTKVFASMLTAFALFTGASQAVTVSLIGVANSATGLITADGTAVSGYAVFVSTTGSGVADGAASMLTEYVNNGGTYSDFQTSLTSLIGTTSSTSPGIVATTTFTDGVMLYNVANEMGDAGNDTVLFLVATDASDSLVAVGGYTGSDVPPLGAVNFSPVTSADGIGVGTSESGFQIVSVVPEPSAALLGAFGLLGLLRRRRA
ncbi:MAG: PEP-CTERM sorting domain-containing protein [Verrucomicrobiota bacterium JB025]|nr:PEP-CTERM sorting domain-containing protein [Verrucomicrobiota bacterium JB025]